VKADAARKDGRIIGDERDVCYLILARQDGGDNQK
jgi:hypothetical protein